MARNPVADGPRRAILTTVSSADTAGTPFLVQPLNVTTVTGSAGRIDDLERLGSAAIVSLLGIGFAVPTAGALLGGGMGLPGIALAGLGIVLSLVLLAAGVLLARADFTPIHTMRIAGWAMLGTVLLGLVLVLIRLSGVPLPLEAGATLLAVSAFAHVLIGVRDVQRIRAEDLARQREKFAVLNRLARHNLRHEAQLLVFAAERLRSAEDQETRDAIATDVESAASDLTDMNDALRASQELIRQGDGQRRILDLGDVVDMAIEDVREAYPAARIDASVPDSCRVVAGDQLHRAVVELVENAIVHVDSDDPEVHISAERIGGQVQLRIVDEGPGIPESERAVVTREVDIDQLAHSQGLGLWFVRWVMDAYEGAFDINSSDQGTVVELRLPAARA